MRRGRRSVFVARENLPKYKPITLLLGMPNCSKHAAFNCSSDLAFEAVYVGAHPNGIMGVWKEKGM